MTMTLSTPTLRLSNKKTNKHAFENKDAEIDFNITNIAF